LELGKVVQIDDHNSDQECKITDVPEIWLTTFFVLKHDQALEVVNVLDVLVNWKIFYTLFVVQIHIIRLGFVFVVRL